MEEIFTGGCLCGAVRYRITAAPVEALYCHLPDVPAGAWRTGYRLAHRAARQLCGHGREACRLRLLGQKRSRHFFCGGCGTPLTWRAPDNPRLVDISIATLDKPPRTSSRPCTFGRKARSPGSKSPTHLPALSDE